MVYDKTPLQTQQEEKAGFQKREASKLSAETYPTIPIKDIIRNGRHRKNFGDIKELAENIQRVGLIHPPTIDQNNRLIAGARRILALEYNGETETPYYRINLEEWVLGEYSENNMRKNFTISEIVSFKRYLEPYYTKEARQRQLTGKPSENFSKGRALDKIAKVLGKSRITINKAENIIEAAYNEPDKYQPFVDKMDSGIWSVHKTHKKVLKFQKREELRSVKPEGKLPDKYKLLQGDFIELVKQIPENSIDLIPTDPPYEDTPENLTRYKELAKVAGRLLKPGGSVVFFVGHIILNKVIRIFDDSGLKYWWTFAVKHSSNHTKIYPRHVFAQWKPMLWYVKGDKPNEFTISNTIGDFIDSNRPEKTVHDWEQSTVESEYIIEKLTLQDQTILDLMMGTGTTAIAALKLNRRFIGIEIDPDTFEIAKKRIIKEGLAK